MFVAEPTLSRSGSSQETAASMAPPALSSPHTLSNVPRPPTAPQLLNNTSLVNSLAGSRLRPAADTDDDADEPTRQPRKKARRRVKDRKETALMGIGAAVGMMGDLFRDFEAILTAGVGGNSDNSHSPVTTLSYRERKYQELYRQIFALAPWIVDEIEKRGPRGAFEVARELGEGRQGVRGVDLHGIKRAVITWNVYEPPIPADAKSVRGFNHQECGRLLCPAKYDWSKPEVRQALQNRDKNYPCGATAWPAVLWKDEQVNLADMQTGFLRNVRLIKAGRYVLLGPRTVDEQIAKVAAKKPKAKIYSIRSITVPFMAYTAVLVHCSLNSQESFSDGALKGTFPYERFYQSIVRFVEERLIKEDREDLISWWNTEIFGVSYGDGAFSDDGSDDGEPSVMAMMDAQIEARLQAASTGGEAGSSVSTQ
ncbi:hypothetical protein FKP32DRAFT_1173950 [Trametes sanguinea]|nr:hypothetical protein FKP32DRAFT_1173950 [Trametes sanguinea]